MKNKLKEFRTCEPVTILGPYVKSIFEARIITTLFDEDVAVETLIIYYN